MSGFICDVCGFQSETEVYAGNWIFFCKDHKDADRQKTLDNELHNNFDNLHELDYEAIESLM